MRLREYEAKQLFKESGISIPPGMVIKCAEEVFGIKNFPCTLKTQVLTGGRGKAGGIKFADNANDAYAKAQDIFKLKVKGDLPTAILVEPKVTIKKELYVSILIDRAYRGPIIMASAEGGVEIESSNSIQIVPIPEGNYSSYLGRKMATQLGLSGADVLKFGDIVNKLWNVYTKFDCDLVEINPLIVDGDNNYVALDGKVTINEDALGRQPRFDGMLSEHLTDLGEREFKGKMCGLNIVELEGNIGILCNGAGLTMATMDLVFHHGGKPSNFLDVGGGASKDHVARALDLVASSETVKVLLVNILGGITDCVEVANALKYYKDIRPEAKMVVRLVGNNEAAAADVMKAAGIETTNILDDAVSKAVAIAG
ncbi:MAG: succinate--CoA ligase subunit beta [Candidatus Caenarcaniphilales bacterium]|jgi:succinyl-CoA synthetase beta subunit|nr:succinate--CoA ligase subunit beta [Candidatus Caenarcaniphilales bacterium]